MVSVFRLANYSIERKNDDRRKKKMALLVGLVLLYCYCIEKDNFLMAIILSLNTVSLITGISMIFISYHQSLRENEIRRLGVYKLVIIVGTIITIISLLLLRSYAKWLLFDC